jgi:hypothetical protein
MMDVMRRDLSDTRLVLHEGRYVLVDPTGQIVWTADDRGRRRGFGAERRDPNDPGIVADFGVSLVKFALVGLGMYGFFFKLVPAGERLMTRSKPDHASSSR